jgi:hypothetical protein
MNARYLLPALALAAASYANHAAAVPFVETKGDAALSRCPAQLSLPTIFHFDKVVFSIAPNPATGAAPLQAANPNDQPAINRLPRGTELDIKIRDNPVAVADLKSKVLTFLGALPTAANRSFIRIIQVTYETVSCPKAP